MVLAAKGIHRDAVLGSHTGERVATLDHVLFTVDHVPQLLTTVDHVERRQAGRQGLRIGLGVDAWG